MSALREALRELPDAVFGDVLESDDAYILVLDVPGVGVGDIELSVDHGLLSVAASRTQAAPAGFEPVVERRETELSFEFPLPMDATGEDAEASLEDGVLELTVPKHTATTTTTIPVTE
ncbi:Hsp20/alpha crystallin family protein [Halovenus rubra]|uniref:Hsp20/alpha crystallin family protein n=2 Tax=Halovenus rubra TaxID=869890 RepID=A0ACC7E0I0_9EURY|nr:Hsp20/alpha crystallin family protein [Halovenus rubra]